MTKSCGTLESAVIRLSLNPSQKKSCFLLPVMFRKGNTAMEGLSGKERPSAPWRPLHGAREERRRTVQSAAAPAATTRTPARAMNISLRRPCSFALA